MGRLTDVVVSRPLAQQGTTGGTSRAVTRPGLRGGGWEPYTGQPVAAHRRRRPLASPAPRWARSSGRHALRQRLELGDPSSAEIAKKLGGNFAHNSLSLSL